MSRAWAMPCSETFSMAPVAELLSRWLTQEGEIVDPFARNSHWGTLTNDLNVATRASYHEDAVVFVSFLLAEGVEADAVLFDPPYSNRQLAEAYQSVGLSFDGRNARFFKEVKDGLAALLVPGGLAISFGWNSGGMGEGRGFELEEILLVNHGAAHNDTICVVERKLQGGLL